jgi:hypothetical protein
VEATIDDFSPLKLKQFIIDFEAAVIAEIRSVFGSAVTVSGCHIHLRRNLRRKLQDTKYLQTLAAKNMKFSFFLRAISCLAYIPVDEVTEYFNALAAEELPKVLEDVKGQLAVEEDNPEEHFNDIQRSIDTFLDYVESTYIGKVNE